MCCAGDAGQDAEQQQGAPEALDGEQRSVDVARATRRGVRNAAIEAREARREVSSP
jgi:hypothetical protein